VNKELEKIQTEAVMIKLRYYAITSLAGESHKNPQGWLETWPISEQRRFKEYRFMGSIQSYQ
jgi:hypothetical protein